MAAMKRAALVFMLVHAAGASCLEDALQPSTLAPTSGFGYLVCKFCETERFRLFNPDEILCSASPVSDPDSAAVSVASAILSYGQIQGHFWEDTDGPTLKSLAHLVRHMPIRDSMRLFSTDDSFFEFLLDHVRLALQVRTKGASWATNTTLVPEDIFLDYVLPYSFLDEKRDVKFFWRQRFLQLFSANVTSTESITEAMHVLASSIPLAHAAGVLALGDDQLILGAPVHWQSETSPMRLSPEQVIQLGGGSCTGTAIVLAAAARSVGIPARVVGCSQSIPDDDHHWIEFFDPSVPMSPLGDAWHTKEGTSAGNAGGPWDAPSGPMNSCLKYLLPGDPIRLNTIWATQWSSPTYLALQWSQGPKAYLNNSSIFNNSTRTMAFVGGENRCGVYCQAWGCGANQTDHWSQDKCAVPN